jgi:hypothetical protein
MMIHKRRPSSAEAGSRAWDLAGTTSDSGSIVCCEAPAVEGMIRDCE